MINLIGFVADATTATAPASEQQNWLGTVYPIAMVVLMLAVFYFLILRPQRKRDKEQKEMMSSLSVGDKVTTIGGLVGVIAQIKDDEVTISTSVANTLVTYTKTAIQTVEKRDSSSSKSDSKTEEKPKKSGLFGKKKDEDEE